MTQLQENAHTKGRTEGWTERRKNGRTEGRSEVTSGSFLCRPKGFTNLKMFSCTQAQTRKELTSTGCLVWKVSLHKKWNFPLTPLTPNQHNIVKYTHVIRRQQSKNCLSVFDHFVECALKGVRTSPFIVHYFFCGWFKVMKTEIVALNSLARNTSMI